jgi:hypothetical protein
MPRPKPKEEMVRVNFTVPKSIKKKWTDKAKELQISVSKMVRDAVEQYLKRTSSVYDSSFKLLLAGNDGVKEEIQQLKQKYITSFFNPDQKITVGVEFFIKDIVIDKIGSIRLQIWNLGGEERYRFLLPTYVDGANGVIFFFSVVEKKSLEDLDEWLNILRSYDASIPMMLVGFDLRDGTKREISTDEGVRIAKENNFKGYVEINPEQGVNVEILFETITRLMYRQHIFVIK